VTRKIIVTIDDEETSDLQASYYVMKVIVESKYGFWVNADIWVDARELVRSERQALQDT